MVEGKVVMAAVKMAVKAAVKMAVKAVAEKVMTPKPCCIHRYCKIANHWHRIYYTIRCTPTRSHYHHHVLGQSTDRISHRYYV